MNNDNIPEGNEYPNYAANHPVVPQGEVLGGGARGVNKSRRAQRPTPQQRAGGGSGGAENGGNTMLRKKNVQNIRDMSSVDGKM